VSGDHENYPTDDQDTGPEGVRPPTGPMAAQPPAWLNDWAELLQEAFLQMTPRSPRSQTICTEAWRCDDGHYEVRTCLPGVLLPGRLVLRQFVLDLKPVHDFFDEVETMAWITEGPDESDDSPRVVVSGTVRGDSVTIRVFARPPEAFEPGCGTEDE
jgi:hypothetical protein